METILRVFQVLLAAGLIGVVLLQRSEGGGLGVGSSGGMGSFMSVRGTANFLTRMTSILGALFMLTCLVLALIGHPSAAPRSIFDVAPSTPTGPAPASEAPAAVVPAPAETSPAPPIDQAPVTPNATPSPAIPALPVVPAPLAAPPVVSTPTTEIPTAAAPKTAPKASAAKSKKPSHTGTPQPSGQ